MVLLRPLFQRASSCQAALRFPTNIRSMSSSFSSTNTPNKENASQKLGNNSLVYIHPLSQIVLLYFQKECHEWICSKNLDRHLTLHRDGTFVLEAPPQDDKGTSSDTSSRVTKSPRIWTCYDHVDKKHWLSYVMVDSSSTTDCSETQRQHRFLLQDNLLSAWQGNRRKSLAERVEEGVQELLEIVDQDMSPRTEHH
jgi:hypothetical protein